MRCVFGEVAKTTLWLTSPMDCGGHSTLPIDLAKRQWQAPVLRKASWWRFEINWGQMGLVETEKKRMVV
jgi:hypothetical protein